MRNGFFMNGTGRVGVLLASYFLSQMSMAEPAWTLAKDAEGIKVYTRVVADSPLREFRGEVEVATAPERVVRLLKDANSFQIWMPDMLTSEMLKSSQTDQYHYLENAVPWPLENRDGIYHFTYSDVQEGGVPITKVRVEAIPDYLPIKDGKVRIPKSDGFWKIVPSGAGSLITYQIHADPGGAIPSWLANSFVVDTPFKTLKSLRSVLQPKPAH